MRKRLLSGVSVLVALVVGLLFGGHPGWLPGPLRSAFVSQSSSERLIDQVMGLLQSEYYRPLNIAKLEATATSYGLQAAVASLDDPYSHYYPPALYSSFQNEMTPQVSGIGVDVTAQTGGTGTQIVEVFPGSPAAKAGLRSGDVITAAGSRSLKGLNIHQSGALISGPAGTHVTLKVERGARSFTVRVTRADVSVPVASSKVLELDGRRIGYLRFAQFAQHSAAELRGQVRALLSKHVQALILDLRDNPGGLVEQAIGVASTFIAHGTIVTTRGRSQPTDVYTALGDALAPKLPMAVLVNRGTASSAEIVTGALKDHHRAVVIGTRTYGKGVFQQIQPVAGGGALDITVGEYYTPNGHNLGAGGVKEGRGIKPNIYVYDNPRQPGTKIVRVAERTLVGRLR